MLSEVRVESDILILIHKHSKCRDGHGREANISWLCIVIIILTIGRIIREATAKSKDGRIDQSDFLNYSASSSRYSLFTPMEASIIFHFAGRGFGNQRLTLLDFAQLLDPRWKAPHTAFETQTPSTKSFFHTFFQSAYSFVQGGTSLHTEFTSRQFKYSKVSLVLSAQLSFIPLTWVSDLEV